MEVVLPNDFTPREYQRNVMRYFDGGDPFGGLRAVNVWHRRAGKDLVAEHQTCKQAHRRIGPYWHIFPTAEQGRKALWEGFTRDGKRIMEQVFPRAIRRKPAEWTPNADMVVELKCGSIWRLLGSDRIEVVGAGPVGVVFSEYSLAKPTSWNLVRPMLAENGGWAWFNYTPRGNNHGKALYDMARKNPAWFCELLTLKDTGAYDYERTVAEARESGMPEALIRQEYLCDWSAANVGAVWGELVEALDKAGMLAEFKHPKDGVFTSWDLGISDATAIWFWRLTDGGVDLVDFYESHGQPMSHYFDEVAARASDHGYKYVRHWLPHDAGARSLQTGQSIEEQCVERWGRDKVAVTPSLSLLDGIQAARWLLQQRVRIHPRCEAGTEALRQYHYAWDDDRKTFGAKPEHDWSSHAADAFRYVAVAVKTSELLTRKPAREEPAPMVKVLPGDKLSITLDELVEEYSSRSQSGRERV